MKKVAIIGGGSIGVAFCIVFARAGFAVHLYEPAQERRNAVKPEVLTRLADLAEFGLLAEPAESMLARITVFDDLAEAISEVVLVQECAPERVDLKRELFAQIDLHAPATAVLASSSSALTTSSFAGALPGRARCLVAHPGNPPYLIPVVEIVPAPFTDDATISRATEFYESAGMSTVRVTGEIEGFIFNRLQGAVLREAYCLVRDGVASVADIDTVIRDGVGLRWSVTGPFETVDLNTRGGIASHAQKMGPAYERMGASRGQHDPWTPDLVTLVAAQRRAALPLDDWDARVRWRDRQLMGLIRNRRKA
ncbi:3-hydroxyacyl-CoA dehydrogenase [Burkholderia sp. Ch1-1]|uniref:L-gulonate 3-dehydrogenase n=1 Tax=Paraburkholderia dioscoreae TaxID=2604047 RepID=A0A5Q4ZPV3_9BURK|nr:MULTISPECIES: 3-hydroxyacyl-CoA dehydrogenase [Paraburkholderia]EIF35362.1 3-hydroxyacyl-CoA dehydrogenase [Burkholderia sp. Ch1-1]MDR8397243.1 3-hydroxyacyl-CoA dehydrogenase [Paraburkholderia sp. USG1]VVD34599.1 3-hydroxyacyl-CoA dehydrogenase [Paraburkholderia dioscoreae]